MHNIALFYLLPSSSAVIKEAFLLLNYSCVLSLKHNKVTMLLSFVLCWFLGLLSGILLAIHTSPFSASMMRIAVCGNVSIVGMLLSTLFPYFITVVAYWASAYFIIVIFSYFDSLALSFCAACLYIVFNDAAWLICILFLFSDIFLVTSLIYLRITVILQDHRMFREKCLIVFILIVLITIIDYFVIVPFLTTMF